ncbi:CoF synthetase [Vibrio breoganii]|uniref:CoF synthetase n=1 Tax=Vibrio breoganii TaxID=553239 RepID=UPI0010551662|nr:CoF synthetase [Vibrio breoganii]
MSDSEKEAFHYIRLKNVLEFAYNNVDFYKYFYDKNNYSPSSFKCLKDFSKVPIVTKSDLKLFEINNRSHIERRVFKVNTGGTSGEPLSFYLDKHAFAREWAYMHYIWSTIGYSYLDLKLTFRGKNNKGKPLRYNVIHNEYIVDAYVSLQSIVDSVRKLAHRKDIKYLHGFPSSIYEFCKYLKRNEIDASRLFNGKLKGVLLGSEYPNPIYRRLIEEVLSVETISWYGHSEMAILAYERKEKFAYSPLQTYGFTESVKIDSVQSSLVGTSYYNLNSPFIRYDTGDLVKEEKYSNGILDSFEISAGRVGDVIYDRKSNPISLTALIFGRHHRAFDTVDHVQIRQSVYGEAVLCITSSKPVSLDLFDLDNVDIEFSLEKLEKPFKTKAGKVPLLIP